MITQFKDSTLSESVRKYGDDEDDEDELLENVNELQRRSARKSPAGSKNQRKSAVSDRTKEFDVETLEWARQLQLDGLSSSSESEDRGDVKSLYVVDALEDDRNAVKIKESDVLFVRKLQLRFGDEFRGIALVSASLCLLKRLHRDVFHVRDDVRVAELDVDSIVIRIHGNETERRGLWQICAALVDFCCVEKSRNKRNTRSSRQLMSSAAPSVGSQRLPTSVTVSIQSSLLRITLFACRLGAKVRRQLRLLSAQAVVSSKRDSVSSAHETSECDESLQKLSDAFTHCVCCAELLRIIMVALKLDDVNKCTGENGARIVDQVRERGMDRAAHAMHALLIELKALIAVHYRLGAGLTRLLSCDALRTRYHTAMGALAEGTTDIVVMNGRGMESASNAGEELQADAGCVDEVSLKKTKKTKRGAADARRGSKRSRHEYIEKCLMDDDHDSDDDYGDLEDFLVPEGIDIRTLEELEAEHL